MQLALQRCQAAGIVFWLRRIAASRAAALGLALLLATAVAALDYATGYELRMAILYLLPIALATWAGGTTAGMSVVGVSSLFWLVSFRSTHPYSGEVFFYWEGIVMITVYMTFVLLLARLRVALSRADQRFFRVLDELHAAVYVADQASGALLYANRSLARVLAVDPRTLQADELARRFGLPPDHGETPAAESLAHGGGFVAREVRDATNGRWYLVQRGPIPWNSARRVSLQVITDISEQKQAQLVHRQHQEMLHQTARLAALGEIASTLAHELNQPLTAIANYSGACLRMLQAPRHDRRELVAALQRARAQSLRAGRIIGRVRDFVRSRHPTPSECDINALVCEALELLEARLDDHAIATALTLSEDLPTTRADRTLLLQVVVNLVQNAIDAMADTAPECRRLRLSTARNSDGAIVVSVADQGAGLAEAASEKLYTPFFTTRSTGLGLGLSICRSVIEAHGGRIWHEANPGRGSTFHFTLPPETPR
ncbi:MAG TPA: ATP-binding protein [Accumulibacter sp.]|uniref:sensor histidine kinase n=2 Tax=Accumulibacter sp. TaxID=2053492 RepID=UPI002CC476FB|nr:ATP-binding protein [Accumulibacter sp.]HNB68531.1 ATP-binding protein [Accumulibacter sp.]HNG16254.1 ATP-binding protein [Accumulibacter sp.]HNG86805.1 ATP-binding protein [Accumulibacter sp.]HNK03228.1 ATP-binding protein [Accumulibacter sp.]HNL96505.1 ATP-binding protein [Accumulibacter sp.]